MLINLRDMLRYAAEKNVAVPSFNVYNVESVQAVWQAAQKKSLPSSLRLANPMIVICRLSRQPL